MLFLVNKSGQTDFSRFNSECNHYCPPFRWAEWDQPGPTDQGGRQKAISHLELIYYSKSNWYIQEQCSNSNKKSDKVWESHTLKKLSGRYIGGNIPELLVGKDGWCSSAHHYTLCPPNSPANQALVLNSSYIVGRKVNTSPKVTKLLSGWLWIRILVSPQPHLTWNKGAI